MSLKKFIALGAALAAAATTATAGVDISIASAYIFRGVTFEDDVVIQPGFETSIIGDVTVGTWGNFNTDASEFTEIDYYLSYDLPLENSPVGISIGYTEYTYPSSTLAADREPFISFGYDIGEEGAGGSLTWFVAYGIDGGIDKTLYTDLSYGWEKTVETVTYGLGALIAYLDPDVGEAGFAYAQLDASVGFEYAAGYSASIGVSYIIETDDEVQLVDEDVLVYVSFNL